MERPYHVNLLFAQSRDRGGLNRLSGLNQLSVQKTLPEGCVAPGRGNGVHEGFVCAFSVQAVFYCVIALLLKTAHPPMM